MCLSLADRLTGVGWCSSGGGLTGSSAVSRIPEFSLAVGFAGVVADISSEF